MFAILLVSVLSLLQKCDAPPTPPPKIIVKTDTIYRDVVQVDTVFSLDTLRIHDTIANGVSFELRNIQNLTIIQGTSIDIDSCENVNILRATSVEIQGYANHVQVDTATFVCDR